MPNILNGYKSYLLGGVMIAIGVVEMIGIDVVPSVDPGSALNYILAGWGVIGAKSAIAKVES